MRERAATEGWVSSAVQSDGLVQTDRPTMSKPRINELSRQKIQELPIEFARFSHNFVTFKHLDKNKVALRFSHAPKKVLHLHSPAQRRPQSSYIIH